MNAHAPTTAPPALFQDPSTDSTPSSADLHQKPSFAPCPVDYDAGAQLVDGLKPAPEDLVIVKKRFSAFFHTSLDLLLR